MSLTLNKDGGKLSKRQGDVTVEDYRKKGYLPEALINFNSLLGWHPKSDNEIFSLSELINEFKIEDMGISGAVFDIEKLDYFNGYYIRQKKLDDLVDLCLPFLNNNIEKTKNKEKKTKEFAKKVIRTEQERLKYLSEIGEITEFYFLEELDFESDLLLWKKMTKDEAKNNLHKIVELLEKIPNENWTDDSLEEGIVSFLKAKELKIGEYLWPMRVALTGRKASPSPFEVAEVLGKSESVAKIKKAIEKL